MNIIRTASLVLLVSASSSATAMQPDSTAHRLSDVVVTGTRSETDIRHLPMTVTVIDRKTLTEQHQASLLPTVMQQVPGLFVTSRSMMGYGVSTGAAGGINLRGISGSAGQLMVLIDGHPQYNGIYSHPISDSYQTMIAERVEILRGPASVLYGSNAMGGVVNIVTRRADKSDGVSTNLNVAAGSFGTIQANATNQVRSGKFSSTAALQYGRTDNHRPRMGFSQVDGFLKLGYDFTPHWRAYVDANIVHFKSSYPGPTSAPLYGADQWITRGTVEAAVENHYGKTSGALSVYTNFGRHKIDDGTSDPEKPTQRYFRSKDALTGISWYQSVVLGNLESAFQTRLTVGIDYQHIFGHAYYTSKATGEVLDTPNKQSGRSRRNDVAGYVDVRQDFTEWLTVDAGLRLDHHSVTGSQWIPQFGVVVRPLKSGELKAMASKGFRNPTMREMYLYPPSNEELRPEKLWSYELSWRQRLASVSYGANIYYIKGDNMIQTVNRKNVNTGVIENCGIELDATWQIDKHWSATTNHSLLHMVHKVVAAPEYKGFLGAGYRNSHWSLNVGLQYIRHLYTAVGENEQKDNFCLLNVSASYAINKHASVWLRGENLLAQKYEINLGYPMPRATFMGGVSLNF